MRGPNRISGLTIRPFYEKIDRLECQICDSGDSSIAPTAIKARGQSVANAVPLVASTSRGGTEYRGSSFMGEACLRLLPWYYGETLTSDLPASCVRARI